MSTKRCRRPAGRRPVVGFGPPTGHGQQTPGLRRGFQRGAMVAAARREVVGSFGRPIGQQTAGLRRGFQRWVASSRPRSAELVVGRHDSLISECSSPRRHWPGGSSPGWVVTWCGLWCGARARTGPHVRAGDACMHERRHEWGGGDALAALSPVASGSVHREQRRSSAGMAERRATLEEQHNTTRQLAIAHAKSKLDTCIVHQEQTRTFRSSTFKHSCRHAWQSGVPLWSSTATTCVKASTRALEHQCMCRRGCADRPPFDAGVGRTPLILFVNK